MSKYKRLDLRIEIDNNSDQNSNENYDTPETKIEQMRSFEQDQVT